MRILIFIAFFLCTFKFPAAFADVSVESKAQSTIVSKQSVDEIEELDPFSKDVEQTLEKYDELYWEETGKSPFLYDFVPFMFKSCQRDTCKVWVQVVKSTQRAYLFIKGKHVDTWKVSTGKEGYSTPNFDKHPNGRVYDSYSSKKYSGGDYNGLGNMPYAVFIDGGFAIHGTPASNWPKLGTRASHGCIRVHPDNGRMFNRLVRQFGIYQTWVTVQN